MIPRLVITAMVALVLVVSVAHADRADFSIRHAEIRKMTDEYRLDAHIDYALTPPVEEALSNGVPLILELEIELLEKRSWLPDNELANLSQRYKLAYHALSQQYLVEHLNTGLQETFADLSSALRYMGRVINLPLIDVGALETPGDYIGRIRARLDLDALPLPLRVRAYASSAWRLSTDWSTLKLQ